MVRDVEGHGGDGRPEWAPEEPEGGFLGGSPFGQAFRAPHSLFEIVTAIPERGAGKMVEKFEEMGAGEAADALAAAGFTVEQPFDRRPGESPDPNAIPGGGPLQHPMQDETSRELVRSTYEERFRAIVDPLFEPFFELPQPSQFEAAKASLLPAVSALSPYGSTGGGGSAVLWSQISAVNQSMTAWRGEAATSFNGAFASPFPGVVANHSYLAECLWGAMDAEREVWQRVGEDIYHLAENTYDAIGDLSFDDGNDFSGLALALGIVGAVATVAAGVATAGAATPGLVAAWTVVAGVSSGGSAISGAMAEEVVPSGSDPEEILENLVGDVDKLKEWIVTEEGHIVRGLADALGHVGEDPGAFALADPEAAGLDPRGLTDQDEFGLNDANPGLSDIPPRPRHGGGQGQREG